MRLINCHTLLLEEFVDHRQVKYAVLSHTWEKGEEVLFDEFRHHQAEEKKGWTKIKQTVRLAQDDGLDYAWIDTCCIDKSSSAELTEAINSMFVWYRNSEVCYAYLADHDASDSRANIAVSNWFKRGWTLQELVAPSRVRFYDQAWSSMKTKRDLCNRLAIITGIDKQILKAPKESMLEELLSAVPVARKMSWASRRVTTRTEDTAYCLLGIFGINMPLLYGEGDRAFVRLQEEIVRNTNDLTILAWTMDIPDQTPWDPFVSIFAHHPSGFRDSNDLVTANDAIYAPDFAVTNKGLKFHHVLHFNHNLRLHMLDLNCFDSIGPDRRLGICLKHQGASVYSRAWPDRLAVRNETIDGPSEITTFFLMTKRVSKLLSNTQQRSFRIVFQRHGSENLEGLTTQSMNPGNLWDRASGTFLTRGMQDFVGCICYRYLNPKNQKIYAVRPINFYLLFGFGYGVDPWVKLSNVTSTLLQRIKTDDWGRIAVEATEDPCHSLGQTEKTSTEKIVMHQNRLDEISFKLEKKTLHHGEELYRISVHLA